MIRKVLLAATLAAFMATPAWATPGSDHGPSAKQQPAQSQKCKPWLDPPAFYIHAGDQIYYDVPEEHRRPLTSEYRLAYREAFFYDEDFRGFCEWGGYR